MYKWLFLLWDWLCSCASVPHLPHNPVDEDKYASFYNISSYLEKSWRAGTICVIKVPFLLGSSAILVNDWWSWGETTNICTYNSHKQHFNLHLIPIPASPVWHVGGLSSWCASWCEESPWAWDPWGGMAYCIGVTHSQTWLKSALLLYIHLLFSVISLFWHKFWNFFCSLPFRHETND